MPRTDVTLRIGCNDLDDSGLDVLARAMTRSFQDEGLDASRARPADSGRGTKGDALTIGTIVLSLIGSGGVAVTLLQVLKAYLERKATLHFEITRPSGQKILLDASYFGKSQLDHTQKILNDLLKR
ncbi:MAG TPA: hypothetical protein VN702_14065 [Acetobacteraceae bacterium]|nr:hypothetical protein [Acetobacteraceae bacterium]